MFRTRHATKYTGHLHIISYYLPNKWSFMLLEMLETTQVREHHLSGTGPELFSVRLVEAENLDWCLFRVSDQRLIKWFGKSCRIFELSLHLNWVMPTSLPASIVNIQHCINSLLLPNMHLLPLYYRKSPKCAPG